MMEDTSDNESAEKPFTITSLTQCQDAKTSAQAADQIRASLDRSHSLTPSKITARIEATQLPASLATTHLSQQQLLRLKQIQFEHLREERKQKAMELIASIEQDELMLD